MKTGTIYMAINKINGKAYIGQTTTTIKKRIKRHYEAIKYQDTKFVRALLKYHKTNWKWEILYDNVPLDVLGHMEKIAINAHDTFKNGYNSTLGGEDNPMNYKEFRDKVRKPKLNKPRSEETKRKLSVSLTNKKTKPEHQKKEIRAFFWRRQRNSKINLATCKRDTTQICI